MKPTPPPDQFRREDAGTFPAMLAVALIAIVAIAWIAFI